MPASRRHRPGLIAGAGAQARSRTPAAPPAAPPADPPVALPLRARHGGDTAPPAVPLLESLARLADLRDRGLLTDAEFAAATASLL